MTRVGATKCDQTIASLAVCRARDKVAGIGGWLVQVLGGSVTARGQVAVGPRFDSVTEAQYQALFRSFYLAVRSFYLAVR
jgi:hypothetical protein